LFAGVFVVELFFFATWWDWSGDDAWGVRFLIPGIMLMTIPAIEVLERIATPAAQELLERLAKGGLAPVTEKDFRGRSLKLESLLGKKLVSHASDGVSPLASTLAG
jgi:hypothetical protein